VGQDELNPFQMTELPRQQEKKPTGAPQYWCQTVREMRQFAGMLKAQR